MWKTYKQKSLIDCNFPNAKWYLGSDAFFYLDPNQGRGREKVRANDCASEMEMVER